MTARKLLYYYTVQSQDKQNAYSKTEHQTYPDDAVSNRQVAQQVEPAFMRACHPFHRS